jgi:hypothetical protein
MRNIGDDDSSWNIKLVQRDSQRMDEDTLHKEEVPKANSQLHCESLGPGRCLSVLIIEYK